MKYAARALLRNPMVTADAVISIAPGMIEEIPAPTMNFSERMFQAVRGEEEFVCDQSHAFAMRRSRKRAP
jgi:hypothetical protein